MPQHLLVVIENEQVCRRAIDYAGQLARRTDADVTLLMLEEMAFKGRTRLGSKRNIINETDERAAGLLAEIASGYLQQGITTSSAIRFGDPAQEFIKFLAERPPFQTVIWGSDENLPGTGKRGHWLAKAAASLECPLWAVGRRASDKKTTR